MVRECRELEVDKEQHLVKCSEKAPLIVDVAKNVDWSRLWDLASELGFDSCVWSANAQQSNGSPIYAYSSSTTVSSTPVSSAVISSTQRFYFFLW